MSDDSAASLREAALAAERRGEQGAAAALFDKALALAPGDAALANSAAGSALRGGAIDRAEALFRRALELQPQSLEFAINLAIALGRGGRAAQAAALLQEREQQGRTLARYWSARAGQEREAGDLDAATTSYERCLALEPRHARALHGRARLALERGEADAVQRYERALAVNGHDPDAWLGLAMAREAAGEVAAARQLGIELSESLPEWLPAHRFLAELNHGHGTSGDDFADSFARAIERAPEARAELVSAWCTALLGADRFAAAARITAEALKQDGADRGIVLAAAGAASANGEHERAGKLFAALGQEDPAVWMEAARHRLRVADPEAAERLLAGLIERHPGDVQAWALRSLAWRMLGDPREAWLHGQPGLVSQAELPMGDDELTHVIRTLDALHDGSAQPVGQSVRGGSQTRGALFARREPALRALRDAIERVVEDYRRALPPRDPDHPLLRHREARLRIAGSWSVRLDAQGHHTVHIHPQGVLSSALYLRLPPEDPSDERAGWLELGGAPLEMGLGLPPQFAIQPRVGTLALFPSTLFHGTRPFGRGRRMTVAFDVALASA